MNEISVIYLLELAWKRIWALILAFVFFAACAFCFCKFLASPSYSATSAILVTNGGTVTQYSVTGRDSIENSDITASQNLIKTVVDVMKTKDIYKQLSADEQRHSYSQLMQMITVEARGTDSLFVNIKVKAPTTKEAIRLANDFGAMAPKYIKEYLQYADVKFLDMADKANKVYPRTLLTTAIAGLVGAVLAFAIAFLIDSMDQAIKGEEMLTKRFDLPLIGTVPDFEMSDPAYEASKGGYHYGR